MDVASMLTVPFESLRWTLSWIVLLSVFYTYIINKLTSPGEPDDSPRTRTRASIAIPLPLVIPIPKKPYLALANTRHLRARRDLEWSRKRLQPADPFPLLDLPPELCLLILAHCASWPGTYVSLTRTSRAVHRLVVEACLPKMGVRLITGEQVRSFEGMIVGAGRGRGRSRLAGLVRHLWVTPLRSEDLATVIKIVRRCTALQSLATNACVVQESIRLLLPSPSPSTPSAPILTHPSLTNLTLLTTTPSSWSLLLSTPNGIAFFQRLQRLRLIGEQIPSPLFPRTGTSTIFGPGSTTAHAAAAHSPHSQNLVHDPQLVLPNLTHLSYGTTRIDGTIPGTGFGHPRSHIIGEAILEDKEAYPALRVVVVTKPRAVGGLRVSRIRAGAGSGSLPARRSSASAATSPSSSPPQTTTERGKLYLIELPPTRTELDIWREDVGAYAGGLWGLCSS